METNELDREHRKFLLISYAMIFLTILAVIGLASAIPQLFHSDDPWQTPASPTMSPSVSTSPVDPLTCYIAANGSMPPLDAQFRCGDNQALDLQVTRDDQDAHVVKVLSGTIEGWELDSASAGTSETGAPILYVRLTDGRTTFTYRRDLFEGPDTTSITRTGSPWPGTEIPATETR